MDIQHDTNGQSSCSVAISNKSKSSTPGSRSRSRSRERNQRIGTLNHLNHNNSNYSISNPQGAVTTLSPSTEVLDDLFAVSQSHEEFIAFYAKSRIEHEQKLDEEDLNAMDDDTNMNWMRFNHLLLPILYQFGHRRGNRIGITDYGPNRRMMSGGLQSEILFSERDRRRYDKTYGVDYPIPEKKKKIKQPKNAQSILSELMQTEGLRANQMYEVREYMGGSKECSFHFEGKLVAQGVGSSKVEAKRECALNVVSKLKTDPMLKPRFGVMILTKELGLTVSKQKGKKKKKKNGRHSKTYSSVPVALGGRITHNAAFGGAECRYRYVNHPQNHLQGGSNGNGNGNHMDREHAVDELYLERWDEFDGRGHEIPTHCHALLDDKGRRLEEVEVMTAVKVDIDIDVKRDVDFNDLKEEELEVKTAVKVEEEPMIICMPPPHATRQKMSVDC